VSLPALERRTNRLADPIGERGYSLHETMRGGTPETFTADRGGEGNDSIWRIQGRRRCNYSLTKEEEGMEIREATTLEETRKGSSKRGNGVGVR